MQCPHCHADNQEGRFCGKCGKPLDQDASDMTRVMPPLEDLHNIPDEEAPDDANTEAASENLATALDETEQTPDTDNILTEDDAPVIDDNSQDESSVDADATASHPIPPSFLLDDDIIDDEEPVEEPPSHERRKKS